jgi:hypothetical protein
MEKINRIWAMPNAHTFTIKPINALLTRYVHGVVVDPFANESKWGTITNDLNPEFDTDFHWDALKFIQFLEEGIADVVLFDPPYSPRQVSEVYKSLNLAVNMQTTQASFWGNCKKEIARIVCTGGYAISCGWNSGGIGKKYGFEMIEILLVPHGGHHNDTIVTVERKL